MGGREIDSAGGVVKKRYLIQEYRNIEDFENACNVLCLDGYALHSFSIIGEMEFNRITAMFQLAPTGRSQSLLERNMESLKQ